MLILQKKLDCERATAAAAAEVQAETEEPMDTDKETAKEADNTDDSIKIIVCEKCYVEFLLQNFENDIHYIIFLETIFGDDETRQIGCDWLHIFCYLYFRGSVFFSRLYEFE